jgi:hypothetical protein
MSQPSFVQRLLLFLSLGQVVHLHTLHVSAFTEPSSGVFIHETCHTAFVVTLSFVTSLKIYLLMLKIY